MSDERQNEQAGAPVEETEASSNEVREAVERAAESPTGTAVEPETVQPGAAYSESAQPSAPTYPSAHTYPNAAGSVNGGSDAPASEQAAAAAESGFGAAQTASGTSAFGAGEAAPTTVVPEADPFAQPERPYVAPNDPLPTAGPTHTQTAVYPQATAPTQISDAPIRDGEIRISSDHPMAALYVQTPMPPTPRGNRGAGVLISLLATVGFAVVFAGVLALLLAPVTPPSMFVDELTDSLVAWSTIFGVIAFFIALSIVVLIFGRAGWWAYVLGGFFVGVLVWAAVVAGIIVNTDGFGALLDTSLAELADLALRPEAVAAFVVAREAAVWFGAWIGARGRKITRANAEALTEYESALAEVQAQQP